MENLLKFNFIVKCNVNNFTIKFIANNFTMKMHLKWFYYKKAFVTGSFWKYLPNDFTIRAYWKLYKHEMYLKWFYNENAFHYKNTLKMILQWKCILSWKCIWNDFAMKITNLVALHWTIWLSKKDTLFFSTLSQFYSWPNHIMFFLSPKELILPIHIYYLLQYSLLRLKSLFIVKCRDIIKSKFPSVLK